MLVFGAPSLLLVARDLGDDALGARALPRRLGALATVCFVFYALGSASQLVWSFFHWRWSGSMRRRRGRDRGCALTAPLLAASWLRLALAAARRWSTCRSSSPCSSSSATSRARTARCASRSRPGPPCRSSASRVGAMLVGALGGVGARRSRDAPRAARRRARSARSLLLAGSRCPPAGSSLGSRRLLPFRARSASPARRARPLLVLLGVSRRSPCALEPRSASRDAARSTRAVGAPLLLGIPLVALGADLARIDYTHDARRPRAARSSTRLNALPRARGSLPGRARRSSSRRGDLPSDPGARDRLPAVHRPGVRLPELRHSYLLEFSAPRWIQCAYNPPYVRRARRAASRAASEADAQRRRADADDDRARPWSCPSKPPELW